MGKIDKSERYKSLETMLPQGARSRFAKALDALDSAESLLPGDALDGTKTDITQAIIALQTAQTNLAELLAYRKMLGVD